MKVLVKSAPGSDDPTRAAFPFLHANALARLEYRSTSEGGARGPEGSSTRIWKVRTLPLPTHPYWWDSASGLINCLPSKHK